MGCVLGRAGLGLAMGGVEMHESEDDGSIATRPGFIAMTCTVNTASVGAMTRLLASD